MIYVKILFIIIIYSMILAIHSDLTLMRRVIQKVTNIMQRSIFTKSIEYVEEFGNIQ